MIPAGAGVVKSIRGVMGPKKTSFVKLRHKEFILEPRYYYFGWSRRPHIQARPSALVALRKAKKLLPEGYTFKIWDCYRTYRTQEIMMRSFERRLRDLYRDQASAERKKLLILFSGGLTKRITRLDTHRRGGSLDLTIVDKKGQELFMGTDHDDLSPRAATDYFEKKGKLTTMDKEARKNRRLLKRVLTKTKFINYSPEWWHWSYNK